jgi:hypothetical protein
LVTYFLTGAFDAIGAGGSSCPRANPVPSCAYGGTLEGTMPGLESLADI